MKAALLIGGALAYIGLAAAVPVMIVLAAFKYLTA